MTPAEIQEVLVGLVYAYFGGTPKAEARARKALLEKMTENKRAEIARSN